MQQIMPGAQWRPLSDINTEPLIKPRLLITHTMVGGLLGTERWFKAGNGTGYGGPESTFGVGGRYDGINDGVIFQWQLLNRQADAQTGGNAWATSIEMSDGTHPTEPFSTKQLEALVDIHVWWCKQTGHTPSVATAYNGSGFGYHRQFSQWNPSGKSCPGNARILQLKTYVWPEAKRRITGSVPPAPGPVFPKFPLPAGEYYGPEGKYPSAGLAQWQRQMKFRGWTISIDGFYGSQTRTVALAFQQQKGLARDGLIGRTTWDAAWRTTITSA